MAPAKLTPLPPQPSYTKKLLTDTLTTYILPLLTNLTTLFLLPLQLLSTLTSAFLHSPTRTVIGLPYVGNLINIALDPPTWVSSMNRQFGDPFWFRFNGVKMASITDPVLVRRLLMGEESVVRMWWDPRTFLKLMGPNSIFTNHAENHMRLRHIMFRTFTKENMTTLYPTLQTQLRTLLKTLSSYPEGSYPSTQTGPLMFNLLMQLIGGSSPKSLSALLSLEGDYHIWAEGLAAIIPFPLPFTLLGRGMAARNRIITTITQVVEDRTREMNSVGGAGKSYTDALGNWMTQDGLTDTEIPDMVLSILFGGRLASSSALCTILHIIAQECSQDDLDLLYNELVSAKPLTYETLTTLPILHTFFMESLRLHEPAGLLFRQFVSDQSLPSSSSGGGVCPFKRGDITLVSMGLSFHDPTLFGKNPDRFLPQRWREPTPEMELYATVLGAGKRSCVGALYAIMVIKTFIAELVLNYTVEQRGLTKVFGFPAYVQEPWVVLHPKK